MKVKPEHREYMQKRIEEYLRNHPDMVKRYETGNFPRSDKVKDLQARFNADLFYAAGMCNWECDVLYKYANDTHINSVLRSICPKVVKRY